MFLSPAAKNVQSMFLPRKSIKDLVPKIFLGVDDKNIFYLETTKIPDSWKVRWCTG